MRVRREQLRARTPESFDGTFLDSSIPALHEKQTLTPPPPAKRKASPAKDAAVAYVRMSTESQKESPDQQRAEIAKLAEREGYRILREYYDVGDSDDVKDRPQFRQMRDDAGARGDFRAVLCWDERHFGRFDMLEAGYWIKPFRDAQVSLVTVANGEIDWANFPGQRVYKFQSSGRHQCVRDLERLEPNVVLVAELVRDFGLSKKQARQVALRVYRQVAGLMRTASTSPHTALAERRGLHV